ncbi:MAG: PadR family transcriptional regulator [Lachnospiraceae bacterium]|nr:PadR family transcriptional regulator [Lachnospiraceae bacterium]
MEEAQLLRGILEGCVLAVIMEGETYGYEIIARLEEGGFEDLLEGTLYPILTRLAKKGMISCRKEKSPYGPMRKYYSITEEGKQAFWDFKANYARITVAANTILSKSGAVGEEK